MPPARITQSVTITRSSRAAETTVGAEVVLMTLESGQCFGLGETGSDVWRLLASPTTLQPVVSSLCGIYDAPSDVIEHDVVQLLEELLDRNLIDIR